MADTDYWKPPDKRVAVNLRLPADLKAHLDGVQQLWRILAEADGEDPDLVTFTYVCERLMRVGVDGVWAQVGEPAGLRGMPRTPEEWTRLKASILARRDKAKRQDKK